MTRARLSIAAVISLLVVGAAVFGVAAWPGRGGTEASQTDEDPCARTLADRERQLAEPVTTGSPTIAVLGDSYTQGTGLSGPEQAWPTALGEQLGARVVVDGVGTTGFTTPGWCIHSPLTYGARLASDPPDAEVVVVQGGVNDSLLGDPDQVAAAAGDLLGDLQDVPVVVVVGPPAVPGADRREIDTIDAALRRATEDAGRVYVPLAGAGIELLDDELHPTEAGQQRIAELVAAAIGTAG